MIRDLLDGPPDGEQRADVAIIGGGIAGLILAARLRARAKRVILIESGGRQPGGDSDLLNRVENRGMDYAAPLDGRARGLGGTSSKWGGALLPFLPADMDRDTAGWGIDWPLRFDQLRGHIDQVEDIFRLPDGEFEERGQPLSQDQSGFLRRLAKWPRFDYRNVAQLYGRLIARDPQWMVWVNATVTGIAVDQRGRIAAVEALAVSGQRLRVAAETVVIAAGAIESTRLALLFDRQTDGRLLGKSSAAGHYLHDHLSAYSALLIPRDRRALEELAAFRFERNGMRNLRFEISAAERERLRLPGGFGHVLFWSETPGPFDTLRDVYRGFQRGARPDRAQLAALVRGSPWVARAAFHRFVRRRLLPPADARFALNVVVEQRPRHDNCISLSTRTDCFGQPLAAIDWRVDDEDIDCHRRLAEALHRYWRSSPLDRAAQLDPPDSAQADVAHSTGTYHPGGTMRMAGDSSQGVVDADLRMFGSPNLFVASTAVFPRGGGANPTLMLAALTLRLADRIAKGA